MKRLFIKCRAQELAFWTTWNLREYLAPLFYMRKFQPWQDNGNCLCPQIMAKITPNLMLHLLCYTTCHLSNPGPCIKREFWCPMIAFWRISSEPALTSECVDAAGVMQSLWPVWSITWNSHSIPEALLFPCPLLDCGSPQGLLERGFQGQEHAWSLKIFTSQRRIF